MPREKLKVLVIRFSSIGDIVLTTPVVRCLGKIQDRDIEVHYAAKKQFASFLKNNPYITKVHVLEGELSVLIDSLKAENFDYIIDLHNNLRSSLVKMALRKPSRSFSKLNFQKWLITRWKINRLPDAHIVDRYMATAAHLGIKNDGQGLDYFLTQQLQDFPDSLPEFFRQDYAAFVIGGKHATKRLPNEKIVGICHKLNRPVVLLGGPEDSENGRIIAEQCGEKVFNSCGLFSLDQSAFMVQKANVVITHDTGLMHIAAAFEKPVISVWGNTIPGFGMYPYMPTHPERIHYAEVNNLGCRPCSKIGYEKCPLGHFRCMNDIDEQAVADMAGNYL